MPREAKAPRNAATSVALWKHWEDDWMHWRLSISKYTMDLRAREESVRPTER